MDLIEKHNSIKEIESDLFSALENTTGAAYDSKAKLYEKLVGSKLYNKLLWGTLPKDYTDFAEKAILNATGISLDIGCGGLIQTSAVYAKSKQNYILLDHSIEMLRIAKSRISNHCGKIPKNINLLQADAFQLPFENASFDNIMSFGMIHCFENKSEFINEALRVLKPNGTFYFTTMTSDRFVSKCYMNILRKQKEFGKPFSSQQILNLFAEKVSHIEHYKKGNMLFISGVKC